MNPYLDLFRRTLLGPYSKNDVIAQLPPNVGLRIWEEYVLDARRLGYVKHEDGRLEALDGTGVGS